MRTIIAGSRSVTSGQVEDAIAACPWSAEISHVVSGTACWRLVPALIVEIDLLTAETWDLGSEIEEDLQPEIGRLRAEIERLERENAELRLRFNAPREATLETKK